MDPARPPRVAVLSDPEMLDHEPPHGHPERPERLRHTLALIEESGLWERVIRLPIRPATREQIERVHDPAYLDFVQEVVVGGGGYLDIRDTVASPGTWKAVTLAAGAAVGAVDAVMTGAAAEASFALIRPPGHHALADRAMGFCVLNNAAIAAAHAVETYGLSRILLVDFDVHHGNGTQDIFYARPDVLFFSIHQYPAYPGTGKMAEVGAGPGEGYTVNVPLPPDVGDDGYLAVFDRVLRPLADRFAPQMVLVSAGYDAHWRNSAHVAGIREQVSVTGFTLIAQRLKAIADAHCPGRLVGILEGGYDLDSLAYGVKGTICAWLGDPDIDDPIGPSSRPILPPDIAEELEDARRMHKL